MFHFPTFPPTALYIQAEVAGHDSGISRFPYSEIPGSGARLPAPLGLSQVTTSFFGSWCQGIHRSHLVACFQNLSTKMLASTVKFSKYGRAQNPSTTHRRSRITGPRKKTAAKKQPTPQDPTACLGQPPNLSDVPLPTNQNPRGCTCIQAKMISLKSQCSTIRCLAQPTTNVPEPNKNWTTTPQRMRAAKGSLERR